MKKQRGTFAADPRLIINIFMDIRRMLPLAVPLVQVWVGSQRKQHRFSGNARPLNDTEHEVFSPFFSSGVLEKTSLSEVAELSNPWFYPALRRFGIEPPLDISYAGGITFDDTIVIARHGQVPVRDWHPLLFHELVHVVQYTTLGRNAFIDRYLRCLVATGMDYHQNPFERQAYALQNRFESAPHIAFSVEAEVRNFE
jgi:hypothetical protein